MLNKHLLRLHPLCNQRGDWNQQPCHFHPAFPISSGSEAKGSEGSHWWSCQCGCVGVSYLSPCKRQSCCSFTALLAWWSWMTASSTGLCMPQSRCQTLWMWPCVAGVSPAKLDLDVDWEVARVHGQAPSPGWSSPAHFSLHTSDVVYSLYTLQTLLLMRHRKILYKLISAAIRESFFRGFIQQRIINVEKK